MIIKLYWLSHTHAHTQSMDSTIKVHWINGLFVWLVDCAWFIGYLNDSVEGLSCLRHTCNKKIKKKKKIKKNKKIVRKKKRKENENEK